MFLFWGGIVTIVANASGLLGGFARQLALRDGRISWVASQGWPVFSRLSPSSGVLSWCSAAGPTGPR